MHAKTEQADDWNAAFYARHSSLQEAMAEEVMSLLSLKGMESVLDVGCGDGHLTARIADRLPHGAALGVDASADMIAFATAHFARGGSEGRSNLAFEVADARALGHSRSCDLLVSFNALHWVPEQADALRGIAAALRPGGQAMLRMVAKGSVTSLEEVAERTRATLRWAGYFSGFEDPYLRLTPADYAALASAQGLRVAHQVTHLREWDFKTHDAFFGFCSAGFGAWTLRLPEALRDAFVNEVVEAYRAANQRSADRANVFGFYQMDITLVPAS
ncbi:MAG: methyltransferase domain-containing protein [Variovorax sp.]